jgi:hypothetical protein
MRRTDERVKLSEFPGRCWWDRNISLDCSIRVLLCTGRCNRKLARGAHVAKRNAQPLEESGLDPARPGGGAGKVTTISFIEFSSAMRGSWTGGISSHPYYLAKWHAFQLPTRCSGASLAMIANVVPNGMLRCATWQHLSGRGTIFPFNQGLPGYASLRWV